MISRLDDNQHYISRRDPLPEDIKNLDGDDYVQGATWFNRYTEEAFIFMGHNEDGSAIWRSWKDI